MENIRARKNLLIYAALAALAAAVFAPLLPLPFVFDDVLAVQNNNFLRDLSNAASLFRPSYSAVFRNEGYEPLTYLFFMLAGKIFGWQAWGFHAVSIAAHAACAGLVFRLALLLTADRAAALAAGLLFALHPAQAETLTAAMFSGTIFSSIFFLAALHRFIASDGRGSAGAAATALLFGASLLFKERTFPGLLLFALLPLLRGGTAEFRRRLPELAALAAVWGGALAARAYAMDGSGFGLAGLDPAYLPARLAAYAKTLLLPFWLSPVYGKQLFPGFAGAGALAAAAALAWAALRAGRKAPGPYNPAAVGLLLAALIILPYLNVLPLLDLAEYLSAVFASNRYLYLPLAGAALALAALIKGLPRSGRTLAAASVIFSGLALLSIQQQLLWRDEAGVWTRAARLNPGSPWARYMLGTHYLQTGRIADAERLLTEALLLNPAKALRSHTLGALAQAALTENRSAEAEALARASLQAWDFNHEAWNALGAALAGLGRTEEAAAAFERSAAIEITGDGPLINLGLLRLYGGEPARAAAAFELALARKRSDYALDLLCRARAASGNKEKAPADLDCRPRKLSKD
ncbi:MAG: hypothetical protein A2X31_00140 [Elusimicrobia bacterium GWB2_63_22]|nr:MAG: hypothetical protein A2X31_00140 [Elusimicrobia bacterium GWB2_63_22]